MVKKALSLLIILCALIFAAPTFATISSVQSQTVVYGNGASSVFSANFTPDTSSSIAVIYTNPSGVATTLPPSQYTITIPNPPTGQLWPTGFSVTYPLSGSPIPDGSSLTIQRVIPLQQLTSISQQGNFYPQVVERALDTGVMQAQQLSARTGALRGTWLTDTQYNIGDVVQDGAAGLDTGNYYTCAVSNTSGTWTTDLGNGDWSLSLPATIPSAPLPLSIGNGGTGATSAGAALNNLGGIALSGNNSYTGTNSFLEPVGIGTNATSNALGIDSGFVVGPDYQTTSAPTNGAIIEGSVGIGVNNTNGYALNVQQAGSQQAYFGSTGANTSEIILDNIAGGNKDTINFSSGGTNKFSMQAPTNGHFGLYDEVNGVFFLNYTPTGNTTLGSQQTTTINQSGVVSFGAHSIGSNGYTSITDGLILQWLLATGVTAGSNASVTLPVSFPNNNFSVTCTRDVNGTSAAVYTINSLTQSGFNIFLNGTGGGNSFHCMAIGN